MKKVRKATASEKNSQLILLYFSDSKSASNTEPGNEVKMEPYSGVLNINFGKGIGKKDVYLL